MISLESIEVRDALFVRIGRMHLAVGGQTILITAMVFALIAMAAAYTARFTRVGRNTYAIGGSESSAVLMGLSVGRTKVAIYALSGSCAAMGRVINALYKQSGYSSTGAGLEPDAIAAVVIGGTLLSGGVGSIGGTVLGVLILAIIQTALTFDGRSSPAWIKIVVGGLLLAFIGAQRLIGSRDERG